jgi:hypothetical protein
MQAGDADKLKFWNQVIQVRKNRLTHAKCIKLIFTNRITHNLKGVPYNFKIGQEQEQGKDPRVANRSPRRRAAQIATGNLQIIQLTIQGLSDSEIMKKLGLTEANYRYRMIPS